MDDVGTVIRRGGVFVVAVAIAGLTAASAAAGPVSLDLRAGRLGDSVLALGRQAGVSIAVDDPVLWARPVPAIRGRFTARQALASSHGRRGRRYGPQGPGCGLVARATPPRAAQRRLPGRPRMPRRQYRPSQGPISSSPPASGTPGCAISPGRSRTSTGSTWRLAARGAATRCWRGSRACRRRISERDATSCSFAASRISSFTGPTQTTVGQYLGDIRLSYNAPDPDLRLYDIASVEVLEGHREPCTAQGRSVASSAPFPMHQ
ncbi:hypothetical protein [Sphingomonas aerolata]|uniref:hypothetical protein n=1 Tax=Sphingomonas aerolata TaxID=185951 RepID=UPI002FDF94DA